MTMNEIIWFTQFSLVCLRTCDVNFFNGLIKVGLSPSKKIVFIYLDESP